MEKKKYISEIPELMKEWDWEANADLDPTKITLGCNKKVWWKCSKGHKWLAKISNRTYLKRNCPYCSNHTVLSGFNDLQTKYPDIAKQWDYEKNYPLLPTQANPGSSKKVWWICPKGHEWKAPINNRTAGSGCTVCFKEQRTSFPEQAIFYYLSKYFKNTENRYLINKIECDIYLKDFNISVEYDGGRFHKNIQKDVNKIKKLQDLGIKTINIRDHKCPKIDVSKAIIYQQKNETMDELEKAILFIFSKIDSAVIPDINLERDRVVILENTLSREKQQSIVSQNPEFLKEWNYEKNGKLKPEYFSPYSGKKVWWKCKKRHEWKASIRDRHKGLNCPYCGHQKLLQGYNDLETIYPELAKEWNYEKNFPLTPKDYITGSNKKVWWKCSKGHEWKTSLNARQRGTGCPYCANNKILEGYNDLATLNPELAKEWNYEKNYPLLPTQVVAKSIKKVWWKCKKGHEWCAVIANRNKGIGCPICSHRQILEGYNDLATTNPEIAKEWNYERNHPLLPTQVAAGGKKKVWWICKKGHEWLAALYSRKAGVNCPKCAKENAKGKHKDKNQLEFDLK